jgi:uncharacterized membrane protein YfcA
MEPTLFFTLLFSAIVIGTFAVLFGGTLFLSLPLFQILFPEMSLAALVGNIKLGSVVRNATALIPLWSFIQKDIVPLAAVLCTGSVLGALLVTEVSLYWVPAVLIVGWLVSERAGKITLSKNLYWLAACTIGVYGGILGAGIMLLIVALLQLRHELVHARANAVALELSVSAVAVLVFLQLSLIEWTIALTWAAGGIIGGYLGGALLAKTGSLSGETQRWLLRAAFVLALVVAIVSLI